MLSAPPAEAPAQLGMGPAPRRWQSSSAKWQQFLPPPPHSNARNDNANTKRNVDNNTWYNS